MDGLTNWKLILNKYKEQSAPNFFNTFFNDSQTKFYDFYDNTIYLICENPFIKENVDKAINQYFDKILEELNLNIHIKTVLDGSEVQKSVVIKSNDKKDNIIEKYNFSSFVTGNSNKLAYAACVSVADMPSFETNGSTYNPLVLYGDVGLGKTHLMHAIANRIKEKNPNYKVAYIASETFTNELVSAIQHSKQEEFKEKYRSLDALFIDDIQFIAGKTGTQEEFFHTFNELYFANKQIVLSSDRPPKELTQLEDRIRSRFEMGLTVDIQSPDFETRVAILKRKCESDNKVVPDDVLVLIAKNLKSNIRELEGALNKVCAYSTMMDIPIDYNLAMTALKDYIGNSSNRVVNSDFIKELVANEFNIKIDDFSSKKRTKDIAYPRQIAMYLCKEMTDMSLTKIGDDFGGRDHTTVIHACKKMEEDIQLKKENIDVIISKLINQLKN